MKEIRAAWLELEELFMLPNCTIRLTNVLSAFHAMLFEQLSFIQSLVLRKKGYHMISTLTSLCITLNTSTGAVITTNIMTEVPSILPQPEHQVVFQ